MRKIGPRSVRIPVPSRGKILYCENDPHVLNTESTIFEHAGYAVDHARGRSAAEQSMGTASYDVVVLGHTLSKDDRHHLAYMAKKSGTTTRVLVLHASGKHPAVDLAIDSREGAKAVLAALNSLAEQRLLAAV
jgi:DNA-binding response OmpR family regulator